MIIRTMVRLLFQENADTIARADAMQFRRQRGGFCRAVSEMESGSCKCLALGEGLPGGGEHDGIGEGIQNRTVQGVNYPARRSSAVLVDWSIFSSVSRDRRCTTERTITRMKLESDRVRARLTLTK
jgi:hypothetical protein